ncbi:MAG: T9SS type A sorting domain-containing protein [Bacteroidales bacterium]
MKKKYYFILGLVIVLTQTAFSQDTNEKIKINNPSKNIIQLMAVDSITYYLNPDEPVYYEYDQRGNVILEESVGFVKNENVFNDDSLLLSNRFYLWDYDSNFFRLHEIMDFSYNENNTISQYQMNINIDNVWMPNTRNNYTYNNNGKLSIETNSYYDPDSSAWILSRRIEYIYNANNLISQRNSYFYDNDGSEILESQSVYTYNQNNSLAFTQYESYNNETLSYATRSNYSYDNNNLLIEEVMESYSIYSDSVWKFSYKSERFYNSNNNVEAIKSYMYSNVWNLHNIDSIFYDNYFNQVHIKSYRNFNEEWLCHQRIQKILDYNYTQDQLLNPKSSPMYTDERYFDNSTHMLRNMVLASNSSPANESTWSIDTNRYHYSLKNITLSLPDNFVYDGYDFVVYPNPSNEDSYIILNGVESQIQISVYDIHSKLILRLVEKPINGRVETKIDVSNLSKGVYMINFKDGKYSQTKKLIVN